jgi:hypothetical protein
LGLDQHNDHSTSWCDGHRRDHDGSSLVVHTAGPRSASVTDRVDWTISKLTSDAAGLVWRSTLLLSGNRYIESSRFNFAGHIGYLRFWPNGHLSPCQQMTQTERILVTDNEMSKSWCTVALFLPRGTRLKIRLFVGNEVSEVRDCFWGHGVSVHQSWSPPSAKPPDSMKELTVGAEVVRGFCDGAAPAPYRVTTPRCLDGTAFSFQSTSSTATPRTPRSLTPRQLWSPGYRPGRRALEGF